MALLDGEEESFFSGKWAAIISIIVCVGYFIEIFSFAKRLVEAEENKKKWIILKSIDMFLTFATIAIALTFLAKSDNGTALAFSSISLCLAFVCLALEVVFCLIELLNWVRFKYSDDEDDLESSIESVHGPRRRSRSRWRRSDEESA